MPETIRPLVDGERMGRDEFERRYDATPGLKRAELVEGVVYVPGRRRADVGRAASWLSEWLGYYGGFTRGTFGVANAHVRLGDDSMLQPSSALCVLASNGGQTRISADDYLESGPELVVDIDTFLDAKVELYRRHGVRGYIAYRVPEGRFDWLRLRGKRYTPVSPDPDGLIRSETFPGLWLDVTALRADDGRRFLDTIQRGIATPEHAAFVARLQAAGPSISS